MKDVISLHNRHINKPVWIVGSDPTLSEYPDDFLDDKIGITLHLAAMKFPNATYRHFNEYDRFVYCKEKIPNFLEKESIIAMPFYEKNKEESIKITEDVEKVYCFNLKPYPPDGKPDDVFTKKGEDHMKKRVVEARAASSIEYGGYGTCSHACMYVAILMGGNPINLIGCIHENIDGKDHFQSAEELDLKMRPEAISFSRPTRAPRMKRGTEIIIEACKEQGIAVNWYKNYEQTK